MKIAGFPAVVLEGIQNLSYAMADVNVDLGPLFKGELPPIKVNINKLQLHTPSLSKLFPDIDMDVIELPKIDEVVIPDVRIEAPSLRVIPIRLNIVAR